MTYIYNYYKKFGYETEVMGASFRNLNQIKELAGCDLLTISPTLLQKLVDSDDPIEVKLTPQKAATFDLKRITMNEKSFRFALNENPMVTEKTAEGIRNFTADIRKLEKVVTAIGM